jgi:hypothetical protein
VTSLLGSKSYFLNSVVLFFFPAKTMGDDHGDVDGRIMPLSLRFIMASLSSLARAMGIRLGGCFTGLLSPVGISCSSRLVCPKSHSSFENVLW